jgi:transposase
VVPQSFLACGRDQELLLPPSLRDWLAEDHLAWCVLDAVEQIDLSGIYGSYRADGWGRAAFDPQMMVALLLYAYAVGERFSRMIERRCVEDVAFRVISANQAPDHATIARFRVRHERALAGLFTDVLELCAKAGLVSVGLVALDGTKIEANASLGQTRSYESINAEMTEILSGGFFVSMLMGVLSRPPRLGIPDRPQRPIGYPDHTQKTGQTPRLRASRPKSKNSMLPLP